MPDHAKDYSFEVIEFTMRANESCFEQFEFGKTLMKVFKLYSGPSYMVSGTRDNPSPEVTLSSVYM